MSSKHPKKKDYTLLRQLANKAHRTFQSPSERENKGWMRQWIVNKTLGMYNDQ